MSIRSLAYKDPHSQPHDIPWEDSPDYEWRKHDLREVLDVATLN